RSRSPRRRSCTAPRIPSARCTSSRRWACASRWTTSARVTRRSPICTASRCTSSRSTSRSCATSAPIGPTPRWSAPWWRSRSSSSSLRWRKAWRPGSSSTTCSESAAMPGRATTSVCRSARASLLPCWERRDRGDRGRARRSRRCVRTCARWDRVGAEEAVAVLARLLGGVHRGVRVLHERGRVERGVREQAHADAGGEARLATAGKLVRAHRFAQELADHALHRGLVLHFLQQDEKFVAAEPRYHVARAYRGAQAARDLDEET